MLFSSGELLIVRTDSIGDYVLFRNFIHYLKEQKVFKNYKFTLLGNSAFRSLAEIYEKDVIDEFIWIDSSLFYQKESTIRNSLVLKLKQKKIDIIINPVHSRFYELDAFIASLGAKFLIGSKGDDVRFGDYESYSNSSKLYDLLIDVPDTSFFEFYRNREFVKKLTGSAKKLPKLEIEIVRQITENLCILIFPGASVSFRRWSPINFANVINELRNELNESIHFIISGSDIDKLTAKDILNALTDKNGVIDKTGKTDLIGLVKDISSVDLIISNETSAVHFAAALGTPAVCISNGERFLRFSPYPKEIAKNINTIYPDESFYKKGFSEELNNKYRIKSDLDINEIGINEVVSKAKEILLNISFQNREAEKSQKA